MTQDGLQEDIKAAAKMRAIRNLIAADRNTEVLALTSSICGYQPEIQLIRSMLSMDDVVLTAVCLNEHVKLHSSQGSAAPHV